MDISQAKHLIRLKQLTEARRILQGLDHPEAPELLAEIERYLVLRPEQQPQVEAGEAVVDEPMEDNATTEPEDYAYAVSDFEPQTSEPNSESDEDVNPDTSSTV